VLLQTRPRRISYSPAVDGCPRDVTPVPLDEDRHAVSSPLASDHVVRTLIRGRVNDENQTKKNNTKSTRTFMSRNSPTQGSSESVCTRPSSMSDIDVSHHF